jgi:hypothetical protein
MLSFGSPLSFTLYRSALALAKLMFIIDRRSMRLWNLNPYPAKIHSFASRQVVE